MKKKFSFTKANMFILERNGRRQRERETERESFQLLEHSPDAWNH